MPRISAHGFPIPSQGDSEIAIAESLETSIEKVSYHNHDGNNSARLLSSKSEVIGLDLTQENWTLINNQFEFTVEVPETLQGDKFIVHFTVDGTPAFLDYEMLASSAITQDARLATHIRVYSLLRPSDLNQRFEMFYQGINVPQGVQEIEIPIGVVVPTEQFRTDTERPAVVYGVIYGLLHDVGRSASFQTQFNSINPVVLNRGERALFADGVSQFNWDLTGTPEGYTFVLIRQDVLGDGGVRFSLDGADDSSYIRFSSLKTFNGGTYHVFLKSRPDDLRLLHGGLVTLELTDAQEQVPGVPINPENGGTPDPGPGPGPSPQGRIYYGYLPENSTPSRTQDFISALNTLDQSRITFEVVDNQSEEVLSFPALNDGFAKQFIMVPEALGTNINFSSDLGPFDFGSLLTDIGEYQSGRFRIYVGHFDQDTSSTHRLTVRYG